MYTKEELEKLPIPELMEIASELGIKVSQNDELESVIYAILDKAAENSAAGVSTPKRKRTRIAKDNSKVYAVNGSDGETYDKEATKVEKKKKKSLDALIAEQAAAEQAEKAEKAEKAETEEAEEQAAPKKRSRKKKDAEEAAPEAAAAEPEKKTRKKATKKTEQDLFAEEAPVAESADAIPEAAPEANDETISPEMIGQLQEKMAKTNEGEPQEPVASSEEGVWEGDPGDGTDFITIVDLPIEDQAAIPSVDIFDRPMVQQPQDEPMMRDYNNGHRQETFDFGDLITGNGVLEIIQDGYGFLRSSDYNYLSSPDDIYVNPQQIKRWSLKTGDVVECTVRPPHDNEKYFALSNVISINGRDPQEVRDRIAFEHLTPLFPDEIGRAHV